ARYGGGLQGAVARLAPVLVSQRYVSKRQVSKRYVSQRSGSLRAAAKGRGRGTLPSASGSSRTRRTKLASRSATRGQPSSARSRASSVFRILRACATPASPPAPKP